MVATHLTVRYLVAVAVPRFAPELSAYSAAQLLVCHECATGLMYPVCGPRKVDPGVDDQGDAQMSKGASVKAE